MIPFIQRSKTGQKAMCAYRSWNHSNPWDIGHNYKGKRIW